MSSPRIEEKPVEKTKTSHEQLSSLGQVADLFELILNNVYSGIIFCDADARIVFMNQVYADLLGVDRRQVIGEHITKYFKYSRLPEVLSSGQAELGQRCSLKTEAELLVNRIPIMREDRIEGVILQTIFKDYAAFRDLASRLKMLSSEVDYYKTGLSSVLSNQYTFKSIIGKSPAIEELKRIGARYADTSSPVLILGPTGAGKELFAHSIHAASRRSKGPFVCLNCGAIPRDLLESELFGYESGAFTGASKKGKPGKIELAHKGTLVLDEIGDLPMESQAAFLRVLENRTVERVGGVKGVGVDFRLVACTNRDLEELMEKGRFRPDLFYRLNTMTLKIPPLSEHPDDIPLLVNYFLYSLGREEIRFTPQAMDIMTQYPWPGNVRELRGLVEQLVSLSEEPVIGLEQLPPAIRNFECFDDDLAGDGESLSSAMAEFEKRTILRALELLKGNMSLAAKKLGISRSTLYEKCKKHSIDSQSR